MVSVQLQTLLYVLKKGRKNTPYVTMLPLLHILIGWFRVVIYQAFLCVHHFCPKWKTATFSRAHSQALTNDTRRHEYFLGLSRLLPVPGVLVSFFELRFFGKMTPLALGGRPQPLKVKHFYEKKNALNDTKTLELSKSSEGNGKYLGSSVAFVEMWIKHKFSSGTIGLNNHVNVAQK